MTSKLLTFNGSLAVALCVMVTASSAQRPTPTMKKVSGVWIEGPGFDITYGGTYDGCASRCLTDAACLMIEYYRPEKKCNLYKDVRPQLPGGASDVGIRVAPMQ